MSGANRTVPATASHAQKSADWITVPARESVWQMRHLNYDYQFQGVCYLRTVETHSLDLHQRISFFMFSGA